MNIDDMRDDGSHEVGKGIYRGIRWWIIRNEEKNCAVFISPYWPLSKKHWEEYNSYEDNRLQLINNIFTPFIYKRRKCREIARILIERLWCMYDRYLYGL